MVKRESNNGKAQTEKRDQAERLLRYLESLSRVGGFAVRQMVELFGIRQEGVCRDIRRLGALGYPLETATISGRLVYRFPSQWHQTIRKVELSLTEIESALLTVEQYCRLGRPHRKVQLAVGKQQALHAESGPPARVRAWQSIVRGAGGIRTSAAVESTVTDALRKAPSESKWCDLTYRPWTRVIRCRSSLRREGLGFRHVRFRRNFRRDPAAFGAIPPLPIAAGERSALVHVLERFAIHHSASDSVRSVILKLADGIGNLALSVRFAGGTDRF